MGDDLPRAFVSFFAIIDPIGNILVFYLLTRHLDPRQQLQAAVVAVVAAAAMLVIFSVSGQEVLDFLGITGDSFKVAAGLLLLLPAYYLVARGQPIEVMEEEAMEPVEVALVPLATPLLAGPGAIATAISFSKTIGPETTILAMMLVLALSLLLFIAAGWLFLRLGASALRLLSRLVGILLFAIAVDLVLDGLAAIFPGLTTT